MDTTRGLPSQVLLDSVLLNEELRRRPSRPSQHERENHALRSLMQELSTSPATVLQKLAESVLDLCQAGSSGVSLVSPETGDFYWPAIAGAWKPYIGGGTPRHFGPCGVVLNRNATQLFSHPERHFPYLEPVTPAIEEALLIPFYFDGKAVGTVWAIAHDRDRRFDAEDERLLNSLGTFASSAYQTLLSLEALKLQSQQQGVRDITTRQAEEALHESEERLRLATDLADVGFWDVDPIHDALIWPARVKAMFGISSDVPVSMADFYTGLHPEDRQRVGSAYADAADPAKRSLYDVEYRTIGKEDGVVRWVAAKGRGVFDDNDICVRMIGTAIDITERKRAEVRMSFHAAALLQLNRLTSRLWQAQSLHEGLDEILSGTIAMLGADMGNVQLLDLQRGALVIAAHSGFKQDFLDFFSEVTIEDDSACGRTLRSGMTTIIEDIELDGPYAPLRPIARSAGYRAVISTPLVGRDGNSLGILSAHFHSPRQFEEEELHRIELYARQATNFIQRLEADDALREKEQETRRAREFAETTLRTSPVPLLVLENGLRVKMANEAFYEVFQVAAAETEGRLVYELGNGQWNIPKLRELLEDILPHRNLFRGFEVTHEFETIGRRNMVLNGRRMDDEAWGPGQIVLVIEDITERKQAESAIKQLNAELQQRVAEQEAIMRVVPVGIAVAHDPQGNQITVNETFGRILRTRIGVNASLSAPGDDKPGYRVFDSSGREVDPAELPVQKAARTGQPTHSEELELRFPDGSNVYVLGNANPQFDAEGKICGAVGAFVDISSRKQTEQTLRETRERFELVAEASQIGYWFCDLPFDELIWDSHVKQHFWLPSSARVTIDTFYEQIHPDDRERTRETIAESIANHSRYFIEYRTVSPDGREKWIRAIGNTSYDTAGQPRRFDGVTLDVTAEKQANAEITRLAALADSVPDLVGLANKDGKTIYVNEAGKKLLGITSDSQVRACGLLDFVHESDRDRFQKEVLQKVLAAGGSWSGETLFCHFETGEPILTEQRAFAIKDSTGAIIQYGTVAHDARAAKQAEEALRRSEKLAAVGRMAATMAHEVNNPLESVTNLLYLAKKDKNLGAQTRQNLLLAEQELDRVAHITKQTLGFYRDSAAPALVDVSQTINDLLEVYGYRFRNREISLDKELDASARIVTSAGELRQVFSNLFINAVDATPAGGRIRIRVRPSRDWNGSGRSGVRFTVADNGCGIERTHRARIFDAFYTTKQEIGTGLGLWLSRSIVQKHGGNIRVHSRTQLERSGTAFSVFWPDQSSSGNLTLGKPE